MGFILIIVKYCKSCLFSQFQLDLLISWLNQSNNMCFKLVSFDRLQEWSTLGQIPTCFQLSQPVLHFVYRFDSIFLVEVGHLLFFLYLLALIYPGGYLIVIGIIFHPHFVMILYCNGFLFYGHLFKHLLLNYCELYQAFQLEKE